VWTCGCQNNQDKELAQARAEAEVARGELARLQAAAPPGAPAPAHVKVGGELFATTQGGDVKKSAGVKVYLIPITSAERELVAVAHGRYSALEADYGRFNQELDRKYSRRNEFSSSFTQSEKQEVESQKVAYNAEFQEYLDKHRTHRARDVDKGLAVLLARGKVATANSDGRFEFHVPTGEYLLLTEQKSFTKEKLLWFHRVEVRDQDVSLSLDQKSAVFGHSMAALSPNLDALDVRFRDILSAVQPLIAAGLRDRVREAEQREATSLAQAIAADPVRDARPVQDVTINHLAANPAPAETSTEDEKRMQVIFRDWAKLRGNALKRASKMSKTAAQSYMRGIDQGLVKSLTKKYDITHEELDRIEAYGAKNNWWEQ